VKNVFLEKFRFIDQLKRLNDAAILWKVFEQFAALDLRPHSVSTLARTTRSPALPLTK
jgi:type I restriction enzyme M protein